MGLEEIVKKLRKVKYGDFVLADDHNDLVDAITLISKYIRCGSFLSSQKYSIYNDASEARKSIYKSVYSERLGNTICELINVLAFLHVRVWSTVYGQYSDVVLGIHTSDHPAGEIINMDPRDLPDCIDYIHVSTSNTTPTEKEDYMRWMEMFTPQSVYVVVWVGAYAFYAGQPFTAYCDIIRSYWFVEGLWE
jgi:hypothetical protein